MTSFLERAREGFEPPRSLAFTRTGKFFVLVTIGVGFGAINTGNNLLFLLLGMMLSLILASGLLSEGVVRGLEVTRRAPHRPRAGRGHPGCFVVDNPERWASLSVEIAEARTVCRAGPLKGEVLAPSRVPWWQFWRSSEEADDGPDPVARRYCPRIAACETDELAVRYQFPERGAYDLERIGISTRFPFSLFEKAREVEEAERILVVPRSRSAPAWRGELMSTFGDTAAGRRGQGREYFGLRDYRPGEDKRRIHWKRTAARGEPVVREQERQENRRIDIVLLTATLDGRGVDSTRAPFERGLERTARLLAELASAEMRTRLWVLTPDGGFRTSTDTDAQLAELARATLHPRTEPPPAPDFGADETGRILIAVPELAARIDADWDVVFELTGATDDSTVREAADG